MASHAPIAVNIDKSKMLPAFNLLPEYIFANSGFNAANKKVDSVASAQTPKQINVKIFSIGICSSTRLRGN